MRDCLGKLDTCLKYDVLLKPKWPAVAGWRLKTLLKFLFVACYVALVSITECRATDLQDMNSEETIENDVLLPVKVENTQYKLHTLLVRQKGNEKLPVIIITHGSLNTYKEARDLNFDEGYLRQWAHAFARRGYLAVVVFRRGYGGSEGEAMDDAGTCDMPKLQPYLESQADDLSAVLDAVSMRPDADMNRVVLFGNSTGGAVVTALSSRKMGGTKIVAVINVSGGVKYRDQYLFHKECKPYTDDLFNNFSRFGKTAHMPSLWMYSQNDKVFSPYFVHNLQRSFKKYGANPTLLIYPKIKIGHFLSSSLDGFVYILPQIDLFLKSINMPTWIASEDVKNNLKKQSNIIRKGMLHFLNEVMSEKVLITSDKHMFYRSEYGSLNEAKSLALKDCYDSKEGQCRIVFENFKFMNFKIEKTTEEVQ